MSKFWSPFVKDLVPYVPGEQPKLTKLVKLNTNENPYGPSPKALAAMQAELNDNLRLYPDPNSDLLKALGGQMIPYVVVVDGNGNIASKHSGYTDGAENELIGEVRKLLAK